MTGDVTMFVRPPANWATWYDFILISSENEMITTETWTIWNHDAVEMSHIEVNGEKPREEKNPFGLKISVFFSFFCFFFFFSIFSFRFSLSSTISSFDVVHRSREKTENNWLLPFKTNEREINGIFIDFWNYIFDFIEGVIKVMPTQTDPNTQWRDWHYRPFELVKWNKKVNPTAVFHIFLTPGSNFSHKNTLSRLIRTIRLLHNVFFYLFAVGSDAQR